MAIDGRIRQVRRWGECVVIRIAPRVIDNKHLSNPGQRRLVILNCTNPPVKHQIIWGGSGSVIIEPGFGVKERRHFRRIMSTRIEEIDAEEELRRRHKLPPGAK